MIKYIKSIMKNNRTPAITTKKKTLAAATSRACRKAARETGKLKQSNNGSYLFSDTHLSSDALDILMILTNR